MALWIVAGCSALSAIGGATAALDVFELRIPQNLPVVGGSPLARDVVVTVPAASGALNTDRIMIRPSPLQAAYLPGVRWSEPAPVMVQTLMIQTLNGTQGIRFVGRQPVGVVGDYAILTELTDFQAEANPEGKDATIRMRLTARLVRESDTAIIASRTFLASAPSASTDADDIVVAFDQAMQRLLLEFANWTMARLGRPLPSS